MQPTNDVPRVPRAVPARIVLVLAAVLMVGLGGGMAVGRATVEPRFSLPPDLQRDELRQPFADFFQAYHIVTTRSFYAPLRDRKRLIYAAIDGMLSGGTGDSHTIFISPQENTAIQNAMSGSFEGIGAQVEVTGRGIAIVPLAGSPAMRAGLRAGDVIVRVDGRDVTAASESRAVALIRGRSGTRVRLGIQRSAVGHTFTVTVTRGRVTTPSVTSYMLGDIAYVRLAQFGATTGDELKSALRGLNAHRPRGLVLDLRDDPGGYLSTAVDVNSQFLPAGRIILWEEDNRHRLFPPLRSTGGGASPRTPMIVLVNAGTASAAEITAAALRDNGRARILGVTTYGKGSVQQQYDLSDGASMRITIRLWLTPRKHLIQGVGIMPDIVVDAPATDSSVQDLQLERAVRLLEAGR